MASINTVNQSVLTPKKAINEQYKLHQRRARGGQQREHTRVTRDAHGLGQLGEPAAEHGDVAAAGQSESLRPGEGDVHVGGSVRAAESFEAAYKHKAAARGEALLQPAKGAAQLILAHIQSNTPVMPRELASAAVRSRESELNITMPSTPAWSKSSTACAASGLTLSLRTIQPRTRRLWLHIGTARRPQHRGRNQGFQRGQCS